MKRNSYDLMSLVGSLYARFKPIFELVSSPTFFLNSGKSGMTILGHGARTSSVANMNVIA